MQKKRVHQSFILIHPLSTFQLYLLSQSEILYGVAYSTMQPYIKDLIQLSRESSITATG